MTAVDRRMRVKITDSLSWLVWYDDAAAPVIVTPELMDILTATPGDALHCMAANCINANRNHHLFPHPVHFAAVTKTRAYIVDDVDDTGKPTHVVRYELTSRDSRRIDMHDRGGAAELGPIKLNTPYDPKGSPKRAASNQRGRFGCEGRRWSGTGNNTNAKAVPVKGAALRWVVAVGSAR